MAQRQGWVVCLHRAELYSITAVQGKFAEPVKRNRITLFGLQARAFLFIFYLFFFSFYESSV